MTGEKIMFKKLSIELPKTATERLIVIAIMPIGMLLFFSFPLYIGVSVLKTAFNYMGWTTLAHACESISVFMAYAAGIGSAILSCI